MRPTVKLRLQAIYILTIYILFKPVSSFRERRGGAGVGVCRHTTQHATVSLCTPENSAIQKLSVITCHHTIQHTTVCTPENSAIQKLSVITCHHTIQHTTVCTPEIVPYKSHLSSLNTIQHTTVSLCTPENSAMQKLCHHYHHCRCPVTLTVVRQISMLSTDNKDSVFCIYIYISLSLSLHRSEWQS